MGIDIIVSKKIAPEKRKAITKKVSDVMEINNDFWGDGDEFILRNSNVQVDIAYFEYDWLKDGLEKVLHDNIACTGYTTCFWHNVKNTIIVYDKDGRFTELQNKCNIKYPEKLKMNIIDKNYPILRNAFSSYYHQVEKAINRKDLVSINHRVSAFLASYFDIIFAINEMPHPGEKKLVDIVEHTCNRKPINFKENIIKLLDSISKADTDILDNMNLIVDYLDVLLDEIANEEEFKN